MSIKNRRRIQEMIYKGLQQGFIGISALADPLV
jgi:hypothetical protein